MDKEPLRRLIHSVGRLAEPGDAVGARDAHLLERFVSQRDEAAFELLLRRHGPMVLGVCRRLLNPHDAEDAFQATFLTLVRRADSISRGAALAGWLYQVAYHVALRLRANLAKRTACDRPGMDLLPAPPGEEPGGCELRKILDEEVSRLPERWRSAVVLCYLEGKTGAEAARELRCPRGTISSRLTRALARLRRRLIRRGLAPAAAGAVAVAQTGEALTAPLAPTLVAVTLQASLSFSTGMVAGGGLSAPAVNLAEGVLRAMSLTRVKTVALLLLLLSVLAVGGVLTRHALTAAPPEQERGIAPPAQVPGKPNEAQPGAPFAVRVLKSLPGGLGRTTTQPCTVQAFDTANLFVVVPGFLKKQTVDIGSFVKRGQVLAEVDATLLVLEEKQAVAAVQQARGQAREAELRVAIAKAEVQVAASVIVQRQAEVTSAKAGVSLRQRQYERFKKLHELKSIDDRLLDEKAESVAAAREGLAATQALLETARADLLVRQSKVAQAEAAVASARANLEAAEIPLEKARAMLGFTRILSPVDGAVTRRSYQNGDYVRPGEQGGQRPLLTVQRIDRLRVIVQVPDRDVPLTEPGIPVELTIDALPGVRLPGFKVARVGFALDPQTRTMRVEIDVPNPRRLLHPGMYGEATLLLQKPSPQALRVPVSCLVRLSDGKHAVYVVRDGKAHRFPVQVGHDNGKEAEVLAGLELADLVVTDPRGLLGGVVPVEVKGNPTDR